LAGGFECVTFAKTDY